MAEFRGVGGVDAVGAAVNREFVPFDGAPVEVAAVIRESDDRSIVQAFRRAAAAVAARGS